MEGGVEQVGDRTQRERHLDLHAPRHEDAHAGLLRRFDRGAPEHRLPDPRVPADDSGGRAVAERVDEIPELVELLLPADELEVTCNGHPMIVDGETRHS